MDLLNAWKNSRPIFDSTFRPDPFAFAINDWCKKESEGGVTFMGSFLRVLIWVWNLRVSYPNLRIFIGDDDVTNAFRLIKHNPAAVSMNGFREQLVYLPHYHIVYCTISPNSTSRFSSR